MIYLIFLKQLAINNSLLDQIYVPNYEISYIFIAEKVISEELGDKDKQLKMIEDMLEDSKLK